MDELVDYYERHIPANAKVRWVMADDAYVLFRILKSPVHSVFLPDHLMSDDQVVRQKHVMGLREVIIWVAQYHDQR